MKDYNAKQRTREIVKANGLSDSFKRLRKDVKEKLKDADIYVFEEQDEEFEDLKFYTIELIVKSKDKRFKKSVYDLAYITSSEKLQNAMEDIEEYLKLC